MAASTWFVISLVAVAMQVAAAKKDTRLFGSAKGTQFSDGDHHCVLGIRVYYSQVIHGIQVKLADELCGEGIYCCISSIGNWSTLHGSTKGSMKEIKLTYPEDNIVQIKGRYGPKLISQLTFVNYNSLLRDDNGKVRPVIYGPFGSSSLTNQTSFTTRSGMVCITGIWGYATSNELKGLGYYWRKCTLAD